MPDPNRTYPFGYSITRLTFVQMVTKATVYKLHPEFLRRIFALMAAAADEGVDLGIGTGWRVQPTGKPGFASPGNSHHEGMPVESGPAFATDMVPSSSWDWMENNCAKFGLRTFRRVNNEPWHDQPVEIPASRNWRVQPYFLGEWAFPTEPEPVPEPPVTPEPPAPEPPIKVNTMQLTRATLDWRNRTPENPMRHPDVKRMQGILNRYMLSGTDQIVEDGIYGLKSIAAVMNFQKFMQLEADGIAGPQTWTAVYELLIS